MYYRECLENYLVGEKNLKKRGRDAASKHGFGKVHVKGLNPYFQAKVFCDADNSLEINGASEQRIPSRDDDDEQEERVTLLCAPQ